jgi:hypothetical protein
MVALARPRGAALLQRNEGKSALFGGLRQWNFARDGRLLLWNDAIELDVGTRDGGRAEARLDDGEVLARIEVGR